MRHLRLILLFYRPYALISNMATAFCGWLLISQGPGLLLPSLILKSALLGLSWYIWREYGTRYIYYFTNRGLTPRKLWCASISLDLTIFLICLIIAFRFI